MEWDNDFTHITDMHLLTKLIVGLALDKSYPGRSNINDSKIAVLFIGDDAFSVIKEYPVPVAFKDHPILENCNRYAFVVCKEDGHYMHLDYDMTVHRRVIEDKRKNIEYRLKRIDDLNRNIISEKEYIEKYKKEIEELNYYLGSSY